MSDRSAADNVSQLALPFFHDECSLRFHFEKAAGRSVSLIFTQNSTSMISVRPRGNSISVRLHRMFLSAGAEVLDEITGMMTRRKGKTPHIRRFISDNMEHVKRKPKNVKLKTVGRFYDLTGIYHSVNSEYFDGKVSARITWGAKCPGRAVRRRVLGSFSRDEGIIRINPVLDSSRVPRYYIEYVVYHEMLHADTKSATGKGRVHSKEFKERERMFKHYAKALIWEKKG
ncbi:MAG: M48 family metallopeptidase [Nitrospirae bacterium]|nr:M48 family metallopeptidase [Nitrospirota bacterium]